MILTLTLCSSAARANPSGALNRYMGRITPSRSVVTSTDADTSAPANPRSWKRMPGAMVGV